MRDERRLLVHDPDSRRRRHNAPGRFGTAAAEPDRVRQSAHERREVHAAGDEALVECEAISQIGACGAVLPGARCGDAAHQQPVGPLSVGGMRQFGIEGDLEQRERAVRAACADLAAGCSHELAALRRGVRTSTPIWTITRTAAPLRRPAENWDASIISFTGSIRPESGVDKTSTEAGSARPVVSMIAATLTNPWGCRRSRLVG